MTSRERVLQAFEHKESDRVPLDFAGHRSSGIAALAYAKLQETLGLARGTSGCMTQSSSLRSWMRT